MVCRGDRVGLGEFTGKDQCAVKEPQLSMECIYNLVTEKVFKCHSKLVDIYVIIV